MSNRAVESNPRTESQRIELREALAGFLGSRPTHIFFCAVDTAGRTPKVTAHVSARYRNSALQGDLDAHLRSAGVVADSEIRLHADDYGSATSLEQLTRKTREGDINFDPTGCVGRSIVLVDAARTLRKDLGGRVQGLYLAPFDRDLYLVLDAEAVSAAGEDHDVMLREAGKALAAALSQSMARMGLRLDLHVMYRMPEAEVIPVDRLSAGGRFEKLRRKAGLKGRAAAAAIAAMVGMGVSAPALAGDTAVAQNNSKFSFRGGSIDDNEAFLADGSISTNLHGNYGIQIDGGIGDVDGSGIYGAGAHVFWRDSDVGLLGIQGAYAEAEKRGPNVDVGRIGAEGEWYLGDFTMKASGGYQFSNEDTIDGGYLAGQIAYYPLEDLVVKLGGGFAGGTDNYEANVGLEYQTTALGMSGLSVFADSSVGKDDYYSVLVGLRFYFGNEDKSLKRRHREDDPDGIFDGFSGLVSTSTYFK